MIKIIIRAFADVLFYVITLPLKLVWLLIQLIMCIVDKIRYGFTIKEQLGWIVEGAIKGFKEELNWIKTGKFDLTKIGL